jgi:hypothetical protein
MAEYCCCFVCESHCKCETEYIDGCSPCEFQYDCEYCRHRDKCDAAILDDWSDTE